MSEELWAHSRNDHGDRHALRDHLQSTAEGAGEYASVFHASKIAYYAGLVHDVGKGTCEWQNGLAAAEQHGGRVGIDHKRAGAWLAERHGLGPMAAVVLGHHGGLPGPSDLRASLEYGRRDGRRQVAEAIDRVGALLPGVTPSVPPAWPKWLGDAVTVDPYAADLLIRMVFSTVVDADYRDTARHFHGPEPRMSTPAMAELLRRFERARSQRFADADSAPIDRIREDVYRQAVAAADGPVGVYRFAAPTGSGKTLATGGFALHHATRHGQRRVIVAVPYTSITEQNADEYRRLLDRPEEPPVVLEHHSGVDFDETDPRHRRQRSAAENWDASFVVTTTVRLFESLFDRRPAAMRRLHRLAGAILVLDEVQSLPDTMSVPILSALRTLSERFGTTVVLASATQPTFWSLSPFRDVPANDVITEPRRLYEDLRRVTYEWRTAPKPTMVEIADEIARETQALAIVNTTADAAALHRLVEARVDGPCLHLSTRMTAQHRRDVLKMIRQYLSEDDQIIVVSTQLVEAGVDLDFPVAFRALAPADAIQQAAGRVNRSGRRPAGRVVVFDAVDQSKGAAKVYGAALDATRGRFGLDAAAPDDPDALDAYYRDRFALKNVEEVGGTIQRARYDLDFPKVAELFKMIDETTVPILVAYEEGAETVRRAVAALRSGKPLGTGTLRELRPYIATLPRSLAVEAVRLGSAEIVTADLYHWTDRDRYTSRGIEISPPTPEELVF